MICRLLIILALHSSTTTMIEGVKRVQKPFLLRICEHLTKSYLYDSQSHQMITGCLELNFSGIHPRVDTKRQNDINLIPKSKGFVIGKIEKLCYQVGFNQRLPNGFVRVRAGKETIVIKVHEEKRTWHEALNVCQSEKGSLVKVDTMKKQSAFQIILNSVKHERCLMWIGLRKMKDNAFQWFDGSPLTFTFWDKFQPESNHDPEKYDEDCVGEHIQYDTVLKWHDFKCNLNHSFICERQ